MRIDIIELRKFYSSCLGVLVTDAISKVLSTIWDDVTGHRILGLGYAIPFLDCFNGKADSTLAFMPAGQGAISWPDQNFSSTALVSEINLPLLESSVDRILMVHYLEFAEDPCLMLSEVWRVLSVGGSMIVIIPNRRGIWRQLDNTPFALGKIYSCSQAISLLRRANFTPSFTSKALLSPPTNNVFITILRSLLEKIGNTVPGFSDFYLIEAKKILYEGLQIVEFGIKNVAVPVLIPNTMLQYPDFI